MTSLINLPATYAVKYGAEWNYWNLYIDGKLFWMYDTKEQAEQAAREHYAQEQK